MEKYKYCNIGRARELSSGGREGKGRGEVGGGRGRRGHSIAQKGEAAHVKGMCSLRDTGILRSDKNRERTAYTCIMYI